MLLRYLYDLANSRNLLDDLAFAPKAIRWVIPLNDAGHLIGPGPLETVGDRNRGKEFSAPQTSRNKNAGGIAEFLADSITGLFGLDPEPEKDKDNARKRMERDANNAAKREDFWRQIQEACNTTAHPGLKAALQFHERTGNAPTFLRWGMGHEAKAGEKPAWWLTTATGNEVRLGPENFTFAVNGQLLLDDEHVLRPYWRKVYQQEISDRSTSATRGLCLITGAEDVPIAATHTPKIKGMPKPAQPTGAALVSFDKPAFTSYGYDQSYNAPASIAAATAYCVALNWLLNQKKHSLRIGPTAVCFWAHDTEEATDWIADLLDRPQPEQVREFLTSPWAGVDRALQQHDQFYSVTLAGNAGRIVVRHWMQMTVEAARDNLRRWFDDLQIAPYGSPAAKRQSKKKGTAEDSGSSGTKEAPQPFALYSLAMTTVRDQKDLQAETLTQLYRAALEGTAPSLALLKPTLSRLEVDLARYGSSVLFSISRFALLRLILNRNRKEGTPMIEPLIFETDDPAYNCGRLLAVLAEAQQKAHDYKLEGAGVAERYFGTACAAPASVFPLLLRLNRHHLRAISKSDTYKGHERFLEEAIQNILALFRPGARAQPPVFPRVLNLQAQGRFALGFYQQQAADDAARRAARSNSNQPLANA
jgi:CRISPR-associated protein Csd1